MCVVENDASNCARSFHDTSMCIISFGMFGFSMSSDSRHVAVEIHFRVKRTECACFMVAPGLVGEWFQGLF